MADEALPSQGIKGDVDTCTRCAVWLRAGREQPARLLRGEPGAGAAGGAHQLLRGGGGHRQHGHVLPPVLVHDCEIENSLIGEGSVLRVRPCPDGPAQQP